MLLAAAAAKATVFDKVWTSLPGQWPGQKDLLTWCQTMAPVTSAVLLLGGVVYLLFGYKIFKWLITVNATVVAALIGGLLGDKAGSAAAGGILAGVTAAALTWNLMKWAVAVTGGLYGLVLGASLWHAADLDPTFAWSGGLVGLVFFGMLSFILFRGCVIMYTSLQGSVMLIFGVLGILYKYQAVAPNITSGLQMKPGVLPIAIFIASIIGLMYQQANYPPQAPVKK